METKIAISSNVGFYEKTYPVLVEGLIASGVPAHDIHFFVGGAEPGSRSEGGVNLHFVDHNSIDFTALISVLELGLSSDYWFLMHDTCYVGESFHERLMAYPHAHDAVRLRPRFSMNIGRYSRGHLESIKDRLIGEFKNLDLSPEAVQEYKKRGVSNEDIFLSLPDTGVYGPMGLTVHESIDFYGTGVPRMVEYHEQLDLYKVKANWDTKDVYEVRL